MGRCVDMVWGRHASRSPRTDTWVPKSGLAPRSCPGPVRTDAAAREHHLVVDQCLASVARRFFPFASQGLRERHMQPHRVRRAARWSLRWKNQKRLATECSVATVRVATAWCAAAASALLSSPSARRNACLPPAETARCMVRAVSLKRARSSGAVGLESGTRGKGAAAPRGSSTCRCRCRCRCRCWCRCWCWYWCWYWYWCWCRCRSARSLARDGFRNHAAGREFERHDHLLEPAAGLFVQSDFERRRHPGEGTAGPAAAPVRATDPGTTVGTGFAVFLRMRRATGGDSLRLGAKRWWNPHVGIEAHQHAGQLQRAPQTGRHF